MPDLTTKEGQLEVIRSIQEKLGEDTWERIWFDEFLLSVRSLAVLSNARLDVDWCHDDELLTNVCQAILEATQEFIGRGLKEVISLHGEDSE